MAKAEELHHVAPNLWLWQAFDPKVRVHLFSSALLTDSGLFLIDPIALASRPWDELLTNRNVAAVLVSNVNHLRNAEELAHRTQAPIGATGSVLSHVQSATGKNLAGGDKIALGATVIELAGAAEGELAFHFADEGGTIVVGDALINLDAHGFALLPAKYCSNQKQLRRSLRQLLDFPFVRVCFAHGPPLVAAARERLETVLR